MGGILEGQTDISTSLTARHHACVTYTGRLAACEDTLYKKVGFLREYKGLLTFTRLMERGNQQRIVTEMNENGLRAWSAMPDLLLPYLLPGVL